MYLTRMCYLCKEQQLLNKPWELHMNSATHLLVMLTHDAFPSLYIAFNMQHLKYQSEHWIKAKNVKSVWKLIQIFFSNCTQNNIPWKNFCVLVPAQGIRSSFFSSLHFSRRLTSELTLIHVQKVLILLQGAISSGNPPLGQTLSHCNSPSEVWATSLGPSTPLVLVHMCPLCPCLMLIFPPTRNSLFL